MQVYLVVEKFKEGEGMTYNYILLNVAVLPSMGDTILFGGKNHRVLRTVQEASAPRSKMSARVAPPLSESSIFIFAYEYDECLFANVIAEEREKRASKEEGAFSRPDQG